MRQILLDGQPFTYGDSLEMIAAMGIDIERLSFAPETEAAMTTRMLEAARLWMDGVARERHYESLLSLCSYAVSTEEPFRLEGQAGVIWRDRCRRVIEQAIADSLSGARTAPENEELLAMLPPMEWPSTASAAPLLV